MKTKVLFILILFFLSAGNSFSQKFGNEWIDYSQKYYSFKISSTGIYKLDYTALTNSGIPLNSFSSENIQVFGRDKEVSLLISDGGDSRIDPGDYLLFYAEKNDSWLDSTLYQDSTWLGNPAYSLFNDTIQYFFTWNNSTNNLRFVEEQAVDFTNYTPSNFILQKVEASYAGFYNEGGGRNSLASSSFYKGGEGFSSSRQNGGVGTGGFSFNFSASTLSPYTGNDAPLSIFHGISTTNSEADYTGNGNHHLRWGLGSTDFTLYDNVLMDYIHVVFSKNFSASLLSNGATPVKWSIIDDQGALTDYQAINYWSIVYPKTPTLDGLNNGVFTIQNTSGQSKIRLDLTNALVSNPIVFVFGDARPKSARLTSFNGGYSTLISTSLNGQDQKVIIQDASSVISIPSLKAVNGTGIFTNYSLMNLDEALLMIYSPLLMDQSLEYQSYRKSMAGGSYNAILCNVEELYLQFGGGIEKHICGIRRFSFFVHKMATLKPVGLFLIGKGISLADNGFPYGFSGSRRNAASYQLNLIPTFGEPPSDAAITADIKNGGWAPLLPTGRITVQSNQELANYLSKIKEYDLNQSPTSVYSSAEKDWQKQILHFGGGSNAEQQTNFQGYLNAMQTSVEGSKFGGKVQRIYKSTSTPFDPNVLTEVTDRIRAGVSIISVFGHASSTGFEINFDDPANWHNTGKYPVMISNSCYTGNMYTNSSISIAATSYVNVPNAGVIAFIGSNGQGVNISLGQFSTEFYRQFSSVNYGKTIGSQIKSTIEQLQSSGSSGILTESVTSQMNLNGDPCIRFNWHQKPEIEIKSSDVWFTPSKLNLSVDSIQAHIVLTNLGQSITDTFNLEIKRDFPLSIKDSIYKIRIPNLHYKDTVVFSMAMQPNIGIGLNNMTVSVDIPSVISEQYDEVINNQVNTTLFLNIDGVLPIVPADFAIVPNDSVTLKASTINPIADFNSYRFEIDTTDLFNSPQLRYASVSALGGVKEVNPSDWKLASSNQKYKLVCEDSTVYFWRVALEESPMDWRQRSFQYINGKSGWGQDHFFQFKNNGFNNIDFDRAARQRDFLFGIADTVTSNVYPDFGLISATYLNGQQIDYGACGWPYPTLNVVVFDALTHVPWGTRHVSTGANLNHNFGNINDNGNLCRNRPGKFFAFVQTSATSLADFQNMVLNEVPDSAYMLIYTIPGTRYDSWTNLDPNMYNTFATIGSDSIHPNRPNYSFSFFCKKGDPKSVVERYAKTPTEIVRLSAPMPKKEYRGFETSTLIGPSSQWGSLNWKQDPTESILPIPDNTELHIKVYDIHKSFQFQIDTLMTHKDSILNLNSLIPAVTYPYIKLGADYLDSNGFTPAQIDRWHVLYTPLPEAAIDGTKQYTWLPLKDTLAEGENVKFAVDIKNIFTIPMDSLKVNYWVEDQSHVKHFLPISRRKPLAVNEVIRDTVEFSTNGLVGVNSLWMEVNPYINGSLFVTDQPEQEHVNNILQVPFFVQGDDVNPILDVTFTGRHILNGDIVSPNSEILITLKDDNPFKLMGDVSDTSLFGIYLTDPKGVQRRIPFMDGAGNVVMQWVAADLQNKKFKIIYPALFTDNGKYSLMIQATDRSGNLSGDIQYRVNFEVIKEPSITYLMNYPNPFSTSTRFVFTLTGSVVPENIIIQIMTVTGRVVREITESEIGRIYIGRNITEFDWNGTDEFGDQLANGVYLYRVKAQINGEDIKHRDSGGDTYFTKDFGKMYILR